MPPLGGRRRRYLLRDPAPFVERTHRVQPFHRPQPRTAAGRSASGSLRPLCVHLAGGPGADVLILNANPLADALHPDAIYRLAVDNDGDLSNDIAFSYVFSEPKDGEQTVDVYLAATQARSAEARRREDLLQRRRFVRPEPNIATSGDFTFFAGARSDAFFFDFDGVKNLFDTSGGRNFTALTFAANHRGPEWIPTPSQRLLDRDRDADRDLGADPDIRIWGRCSLRRDGELLHVDRAGHPSVSSFFNTDDTKEEYNASEPVNDRTRWIDMFIHCWVIPAANRAKRRSKRSTTRAPCPTC